VIPANEWLPRRACPAQAAARSRGTWREAGVSGKGVASPGYRERRAAGRPFLSFAPAGHRVLSSTANGPRSLRREQLWHLGLAPVTIKRGSAAVPVQ
jgi:hypothetical protein